MGNEEALRDDAELSRPLRLHPLRYIAVLLLLGLALHFFLPRLVTFEESLRVVRKLAWWTLLLIVGAELCSYVANGWLLFAGVGLSNERISLRRAIAIVMSASTVCLVAGGIVGYAASVYRWTRDSGVRRRTATIASSVPPLFDSAALVTFGLISAAILLRAGKLSTPAALGVTIISTALVGLIVLVLVGLAAPARLRSWRWLNERAGERLERVEETVETARDSIRRGDAVLMSLAALLNLAFDVTALGCAFLAAGHHVKLLVLLGGYGVPLLLGRSSFVPGGVAVVEVAMTGSYVSLGVPAEVAVVAVLIYRVFSFWIPSLAGIPTAILLQTRRPRTDTPRPD